MFELFYIYICSAVDGMKLQRKIYIRIDQMKKTAISYFKKMKKKRNFINLASLAAFQQQNNFFN